MSHVCQGNVKQGSRDEQFDNRWAHHTHATVFHNSSPQCAPKFTEDMFAENLYLNVQIIHNSHRVVTTQTFSTGQMDAQN